MPLFPTFMVCNVAGCDCEYRRDSESIRVELANKITQIDQALDESESDIPTGYGAQIVRRYESRRRGE